MPTNKVADSIEYLKAITEQLKMQQEVRDKWFRFYLIMVGPIFGALVVILRSDLMKNNVDYTNWLTTILCFCIFLIGLLFFLMYVRQRFNHLILYRRIEIIEKTVIEPAIFGTDRKIVYHKHYQFGADFYASCIYIFLNSFWLTLGVFFVLHHQKITITKPIETAFFLVELAVFILAIFFQDFVRRLILNRHKKKDEELIKGATGSQIP